MKKLYLFPLSMLFVSAIAFSQSKKQTQKYTAKYDTSKLKQIKQRASDAFDQTRLRAIAENIPLTVKDDKGKYSVLYSFDENGDPVYITSNNVNAAKSTRTNFLNTGGGLGLNLEGQNMTAYVWEVGSPRITHQEFDGPGGQDRVSQIDNFNFYENHGNHVIGTIAAAGINHNAKGMAPKANIKAYTAFSDLTEAVDAALDGMLVSSHSYERNTTDFPVSFKVFGSYNLNAQLWDEIAYNSPYYLHVKAAGNNGDKDNLNTQPLNGNAPYDKLLDNANSKNNLIIASMEVANVNENGVITSPVTRSSFSSEGPTDDLRIKPDLSGVGQDLFSSFSFSDTAYGVLSGTSMATPNVSGSLLLLQEHYNNLNGNFMRAATLKGLALHTADDVLAEGPDVISGWGLLNSKKAAETITNSGATSLIEEIELYTSQSYTITVHASGLEDLKGSISWTDVPGELTFGGNVQDAVLVNDLDIRIEQNNTIFEPFKLLSQNTNGTGDNDRDPFERIDIANASGNYKITVSYKGTLTNQVQAFSLILTGIDAVVTPGELGEIVVAEFPYYESFENGFGVWTQPDNGDLTWTLNSGTTPTEGTGPSEASDGEFYAFVESTRETVNYPFENVYLYSPKFNFGSTEEATLSFSYHNMGTGDLGYLELEVKVFDDFWIPIWNSPYNSVSEWQTETVDLSFHIKFNDVTELRFSRTPGFSKVADMAVDDIAINIDAATILEPDNYCEIGAAEPDNEFEWISRVSIGRIQNFSGPSENGYSDFTGLQEMYSVIEPGTFRSIVIEPKWLEEVFPEDYAVYIDYNRDGDFEDDGELVYEAFFTDNRFIIGSFDVPETIGYGRTRMRVIMHFDIINGPCDAVAYGEVEDYNLVLMGENPNQGYPYNYYKESNADIEAVKVYPNPVTKGVLNIKVLEENISNYEVYNILGQIVRKGEYIEQLNVSDLANGMYVVKLYAPTKTFVERFIKK